MSKPVLKEDPIPYSSGYTLDVYCRFEHGPETWEADCERATFGGRSLADCKRRAIKAGWTFHVGDKTTCPYHNKTLRGNTP